MSASMAATSSSPVSLRAIPLLFASALFAALLGAQWGMEAYHVLETFSESAEEMTRTTFGNEIHSLLRRGERLSLAFALFTLFDLVWLPWLNVEEVATGRGKWKTCNPSVRAAVTLGWFLALYGFLQAFSSGI